MSPALIVGAYVLLVCMRPWACFCLCFPLPWIHSAGFQEDFDVYLGNVLLEGFPRA